MARYTLEDCRDNLLREFALFERRVLDSIEHFEATLTSEFRAVGAELRAARCDLGAFQSDAERGFDRMEERFDDLKGGKSDKT